MGSHQPALEAGEPSQLEAIILDRKILQESALPDHLRFTLQNLLDRTRRKLADLESGKSNGLPGLVQGHPAQGGHQFLSFSGVKQNLNPVG